MSSGRSVTVAEAKHLLAKSKQVNLEHFVAVLGLWDDAIRSAAGSGRDSVRESELPTIRTPIDPKVFKAARDELKARGFTVSSASDGPNETTYEVSWA